MEEHFRGCAHCTAVLDGTRNVVRLVGDHRSFELPDGFSQRLKQRLSAPGIAPAPSCIPLGITEDSIALGSHLVHFWETPEEFRRGVSFLELGLQADDYALLFGHAEANERVLQILHRSGLEISRLLESGRLLLLQREVAAEETLARIAAGFEQAQRRGARAIRYLGNLGAGKTPLPGRGEDEVLELEARVTTLAQRYPCVVVCMYELPALSGRLVLKGGLHTHPWMVCGHTLQQNLAYVPEQQFLAELRRV